MHDDLQYFKTKDYVLNLWTHFTFQIYKLKRRKK